VKNNRITIRLTDELYAKIQHWALKSQPQGLKMSDVVRQAIVSLPNSPQDITQVQFSMRIKPLQNQNLQIELKDEKVALKALQEW
jgi:hypothetical protein